MFEKKAKSLVVVQVDHDNIAWLVCADHGRFFELGSNFRPTEATTQAVMHLVERHSEILKKSAAS